MDLFHSVRGCTTAAVACTRAHNPPIFAEMESNLNGKLYGAQYKEYIKDKLHYQARINKNRTR